MDVGTNDEAAFEVNKESKHNAPSENSMENTNSRGSIENIFSDEDSKPEKSMESLQTSQFMSTSMRTAKADR